MRAQGFFSAEPINENAAVRNAEHGDEGARQAASISRRVGNKGLEADHIREW
jgi:hypothetical protein